MTAVTVLFYKRGQRANHLLVGYEDRQNLRRTNIMSNLGADMLTNLQYNGANFPEADHAQLWLNDPVVREGFDAQTISEALLKARLSTYGTNRLRIGVMSSDKSKVC